MRSVSKQGQLQPHCHSEARSLSRLFVLSRHRSKICPKKQSQAKSFFMFSEKRGTHCNFFLLLLSPTFSNLDLINIISLTYLDSRSNESSRRKLAEKPANFAGCRLLYTTLFCFSSHNSVFFSRNPKRDLGGIKYWRFARNTLSETKIQNLHP